MADKMETTWDGLPISKEPPHGCAIVVFKRTHTGVLYLTLHRKHEGPDYCGDWAWGPPAGARLPSEPVQRCAERELWEETGLRLSCTLTDAGDQAWYVYVAEASEGQAVVLSDEHDRFAWLPLQEAANISLPERVGEQILRVGKLIGDPSADR